MKEDMYTYHYYKNRSIVPHDHTSDYVVQAVLLCAVILTTTLFLHLH